MRIYTAYSPSHEVFKPWFKTIYEVHPDIDIKYYTLQQHCPTAEFSSNGWNKTTGEKLEKILQIFDDYDEVNYFIFSDIDVQFFRPIREYAALLKQYDVVFQNDYGPLGSQQCTGFFYCKKSNETRKMFAKALEINHNYRDDQESVQQALQLCNVKHSLLSQEFFTYGMFWKEQWLGDHFDIPPKFNIPKNIAIHHSNWVKGLRDKLELLQIVRNNYNEGRFL